MQIPGNRRFLPSKTKQFLASQKAQGYNLEYWGKGWGRGAESTEAGGHKFRTALVCLLLLYCSNRTLTKSNLGDKGFIWLICPNSGPWEKLRQELKWWPCLLVCSLWFAQFASCTIQDQGKEEAPLTVDWTPASVINQKYISLIDRPIFQLRFPLPK